MPNTGDRAGLSRAQQEAVPQDANFTLSPGPGSGRELLFSVLDNICVSVDGRNHYYSLKFNPVESHSFEDEMGDTTILPDGYFVDCTHTFQAPEQVREPGWRGALGIANERLVSRKGPVVEATDLKKLLQTILKQHSGEKTNPYALKLLPSGKLWLSAAALESLLEQKYIWFWSEDRTEVSVHTKSGQPVVGEVLSNLIRTTQGLPEEFRLSDDKRKAIFYRKVEHTPAILTDSFKDEFTDMAKRFQRSLPSGRH